MGKLDFSILIHQEKRGEPAPFFKNHPLPVKLGHLFFFVGQAEERQFFDFPHVEEFALGVLADRGYLRLGFFEFFIIFLETVQVPLGLLSGESPQEDEEDGFFPLEAGERKRFVLKIHQGEIRGR